MVKSHCNLVHWRQPPDDDRFTMTVVAGASMRQVRGVPKSEMRWFMIKIRDSRAISGRKVSR
jgi:hypothetical protein